MRLYVTGYNQVRFVARFATPPQYVKQVLAAANVPDFEWDSVAPEFPELAPDFLAQRMALAKFRSPQDVLEFTLETLARVVLQTAADTGPPGSPKKRKPWAGALGAEYAKYALARILRGEKLLSKPGPFDFKIFGGESDVADEANYDMAEVGGEDVMDERIAAAMSSDNDDNEFSLEGMDYDGENE